MSIKASAPFNGPHHLQNLAGTMPHTTREPLNFRRVSRQKIAMLIVRQNQRSTQALMLNLPPNLTARKVSQLFQVAKRDAVLRAVGKEIGNM